VVPGAAGGEDGLSFLTFGGNYTDDQITGAAGRVNTHAFIAALPDGYDAIVGDQGLKLSGGEKQRIVSVSV